MHLPERLEYLINNSYKDHITLMTRMISKTTAIKLKMEQKKVFQFLPKEMLKINYHHIQVLRGHVVCFTITLGGLS
jgi:hypothetical protein